MRQGTADYSIDPTSTTTTTYRGYEMLVHGFGPGFSGPLQLVAPLRRPGRPGQLRHRRHRRQPHPAWQPPAGTRIYSRRTRPPAVALAEVYPAGPPQAVSTSH